MTVLSVVKIQESGELNRLETQEIISLHQEITSHLKTSLQMAIRVGQLLTEQKESLGHGHFTPWIKEHLPFKERTARNYMRLYRERDRLKTATVTDLGAAYKLLSPPRKVIDEDETLIPLSDIEPNPFWDMGSDKMLSSQIDYWRKIISSAPDAYSYPDSILTVRQHNGKYQLANQHHQLAALRILSKFKSVPVSVVDLTDKQMKEISRLENARGISLCWASAVNEAFEEVGDWNRAFQVVTKAALTKDGDVSAVYSTIDEEIGFENFLRKSHALYFGL